MRGIITAVEISSGYPLDIPEQFDTNKLPNIEREQIIWFDKVHMIQHGGPLSNYGYQIGFLRDDVTGKFSYSNTAKYASKKARTTYKYAGQAKFCLGVAEGYV